MNDQGVPLVGRFKRAHYAFVFLNALFTSFFVFACAFLINYRSIFQSGILGFLHVCTGVLIGVCIVSNVLESDAVKGGGETPGQLRARRQRQEFRVFRRSAATVIIVSTLGVILSIFYLYNLFYIMINICPQYHGHTAQNNLVDVRLSFEHKPPGEYYSKRNFLIFKYNLSSREVIKKSRHRNPNVDAYHNWFVQNEVHAYDAINTHAIASDATAQTSGETESTPLFCMKKNGASIFSFIENEINHVLYENLQERRDRTSFRVLDLNFGSVLHTTNEEEEDMDLHLLTNKICRNEQAIAIGILCFVILWDLLSIANIAYNIWLLQQVAPEPEGVAVVDIDQEKPVATINTNTVVKNAFNGGSSSNHIMRQQQQQQQLQQRSVFIPINKKNVR